MIVNHAGKGVINAVIDIIKQLSVSPGFADDFCDQRCRGRGDESSRLGNNLDILGEQSVAFGIDEARQLFKFGNLRVIRYGKSSADVEDLQGMPFFPGIFENRRAMAKRFRIIIKIRALASHMKAHSFDHEPRVAGLTDQLVASPGSAPNFELISTCEPVSGTFSLRINPAVSQQSFIFFNSSLLSNVTRGQYLLILISVSLSLMVLEK